jgi:hypothetical protein
METTSLVSFDFLLTPKKGNISKIILLYIVYLIVHGDHRKWFVQTLFCLLSVY